MKIAQVAVVLPLLLVLSATRPAQTVASPVNTTLTLSVADTYPNGLLDVCTNETVMFTGTIQVTTAVWFDLNGGTHIRLSDKFNVTGIGNTSQLSYILNGGDTQVSYSNVNAAPQEMTVLNRQNIIGTGPLPNELARSLMQINVLPDGTTTGFLVFLTPTCPGH